MSAATSLTQEWHITPARAWHAERLLSAVREADRAELWTGWRQQPREALAHGLQHSSHAWTALVNFEPVCMYGVVPQSLLGGAGVIWLIGAESLPQVQLGFLRRCRPQLQRMRSVYAHLYNHVAADNVFAVRWLKWMGFTVHQPKPFGPDGAAFSYFEWRRDV